MRGEKIAQFAFTEFFSTIKVQLRFVKSRYGVTACEVMCCFCLSLVVAVKQIGVAVHEIMSFPPNAFITTVTFRGSEVACDLFNMKYSFAAFQKSLS